jgi:Ca2+-transporting ATPase
VSYVVRWPSAHSTVSVPAARSASIFVGSVLGEPADIGVVTRPLWHFEHSSLPGRPVAGDARATGSGRPKSSMMDAMADGARPTPLTASAGAHAMPAERVAERLGVDPRIGLPTAEVTRRAADAGPNALEPPRREGVGHMLLEAATEPFVLLLLAAGVGAVLLGETRDGLLVLLGLIPIVGADVVTEFRGERALEALRDASAPMARVRRDGAVAQVVATGLVPGDVVLLAGGDVVPADLRLTRADRLLLDRSILTGESIPEPGRVEPDPADAVLADRRSIAFSGTSVVGGRGEGIVVAVGRATELGRIAGGLGERGRRRSPLQAELDRLVRILLVVAIGLIAIVTSLGFLRGQDAGANVLAGISAAIAAIPEEPPILLAVVLGLGAYRLLKRGVLVRRLNAEESLGAVDLIVTDKTGTLTKNRLEVASVRTLEGPVTDPTTRLRLLVDALRAEEDAWATGDGAPPGSFTRSLARAIAAGGEPHALDRADLLEAEPVTDARPFSSTRARRDGAVETLRIGAPEAVLAEVAPVRNERTAWELLIEASAASGERTVALAGRIDDGPWRIRALIGFADPLRDGIREALATARGAGIQTVVVTGDHPRTAAAIAAQAGLDRDHIVLGRTLAGWDDARVAQELGRLQVVARSTPEGKERLVRIARLAGRTVAVTGDGVNDAPALNRADVAVAMGSGTAVAREAADLVLGDDSFATLMFGLREGRRIVDNVQKGLVFLVSTHVALLGFILIATLYGFGQPLLPIQILWLELFIDLSTSVAFEREPAEPDVMRRPPRRRAEPLLSRDILLRVAGAGGFSAVAALVIMASHDGPADHARWLAYTTLVCSQVVRAYANRSLHVPLHRLSRNSFLLAACLLVLTIQVAIPFVPALADAFRATPLALGEWAIVALVALAPAVLAEAVRTARGRTWVA